MNHNTIPESVHFRIAAIETRQYAFLPKSFAPENPVTEGEMDLQFACDKAQQFLIVSAKAQLGHELNSAQPFLICEVACFFSIAPDDWRNKLLLEDGSIRLSKIVMSHFAMLTVGTLRGVLHAKAQGSLAASHAVLQVVNVLEAFPEEMIFS